MENKLDKALNQFGQRMIIMESKIKFIEEDQRRSKEEPEIRSYQPSKPFTNNETVVTKTFVREEIHQAPITNKYVNAPNEFYMEGQNVTSDPIIIEDDTSSDITSFINQITARSNESKRIMDQFRNENNMNS
ncbi:hypothetical protein AKO1_006333 [Acrasis kona]|uniref:Uncharacterized protein n=1 Tax=Acrasis kona TaxID=1008807 RepID=A0AAW2YJQ0_9EUKA